MHIYINTIEKSRTAKSDKNTNSCPNTCNKAVTGVIVGLRLEIKIIGHAGWAKLNETT